jgi:SpoIIAA-like
MIEPIEGAPEGVLAFRAVGKVEESDYDNVLKPAIEQASAGGKKLRLVYELGPEFEKMTAAATWEDTKLGVGHLTDFEKVAVITDSAVLSNLVRLFGYLIPGEVKAFPLSDRDKALIWAGV